MPLLLGLSPNENENFIEIDDLDEENDDDF